MNRIHAAGWVIVIGVCACASTASGADQIELVTGEKLTGTIKVQTDEAVVFEHPVLGELSVPKDKIVSVMTADQLAEAREAQEMQAAEASAQAAPPAQPADSAAQSAAAADVAEAEEVMEAKQPLFRLPDFMEGFKSHLEAGFNGAQGNKENLNLFIAFGTARKREIDRTKFDASFFLNTSEDRTTKEEFNAAIRHDWLLPDSPWFYFGEGTYERDRFAQFEHRVTAAGGLGVDLVREDRLTVTVRGGAGGAKEFGSEDEDFRPEGHAGAEAVWQLTENQTLAGATTYYSDLSDTMEFRIVSNAEWKVKINHADGVSLKFGLKNEYESLTDNDSEHNDLKYYGALVIDF